MPPERRSRTKPDRRTGGRLGRKSRMKPDRKAGAGPGGPPRKAAPSSQRKPPARPSAAAAAIAVAAEEERRLRQRNRLTLEEDKPAVERCLEELVFGDVEDDEDALLRRLQGSRVREAAARGLGALGRGARWAASLRGRSLGDLRRRERSGRRAPEKAGADDGCQTGSLRWAETSPFSAPGGSPCVWYPAGALHVRVANCSRDQFSRLSPTVLPPNSMFFPRGRSISSLGTLPWFGSYGIGMCVLRLANFWEWLCLSFHQIIVRLLGATYFFWQWKPCMLFIIPFGHF